MSANRIVVDASIYDRWAVFTRDGERGVRFALRVEAGMTHVNEHSVDDTSTGPCGGEKNGGLGRFGGEWILREFTRDHWVTLRHSNGPYPFQISSKKLERTHGQRS